MCYGVYLSTDSDEDLTRRNSDLVRFEKIGDPKDDPCISLLAFSRRWYVGSKSACSCTFRHLVSTELGFTEPVDWYEEEQDELDATRELCGVLRSLVEAGHPVDLVDRWEGCQPEDVTSIEVSLADVTDREFRLFENHRFRFMEGKNCG